jgi:hypothetical protein
MSRGDDFIDAARDRVRKDIEEGFKEVLSSRHDAQFSFGLHGSDLDDDSAIATSDDLVVLAWRYPCTHTGPFMNIDATGVDLELRGTTFVDLRSSEWTYHRYIDFVGALHQIGVSYAVRPVVADDLVETEDDAQG